MAIPPLKYDLDQKLDDLYKQVSDKNYVKFLQELATKPQIYIPGNEETPPAEAPVKEVNEWGEVTP